MIVINESLMRGRKSLQETQKTIIELMNSLHDVSVHYKITLIEEMPERDMDENEYSPISYALENLLDIIEMQRRNLLVIANNLTIEQSERPEEILTNQDVSAETIAELRRGIIK